MRMIHVGMTDLNSGTKVFRSIDLSNFTVCMDGPTMISTEKQIKILNDWIARRANPQHDTLLMLDSHWIG